MSPRARDAGEEAAAGGASTAADRAESGSQDARATRRALCADLAMLRWNAVPLVPTTVEQHALLIPFA
eukprot:scaffold23219_cov131-Isochrysis_galbana.AAC.3